MKNYARNRNVCSKCSLFTMWNKISKIHMQIHCNLSRFFRNNTYALDNVLNLFCMVVGKYTKLVQNLSIKLSLNERILQRILNVEDDLQFREKCTILNIIEITYLSTDNSIDFYSPKISMLL